MDNIIEFKCQADNLEEIPAQISEELGITFPEAHTNSRDMSILAKAIKSHTEASICIIPFCTTVEAEALGGKIKLGDSKTGPRVEGYSFGSLEALNNVKRINLSNGRIKEVLDCVEKLSKEGEVVALNVEGPFTIISSLIDPMLFYRGLRKDKASMGGFIDKVEEAIVEYILEGINRGAKIISYGDPVGAMDIVGPSVYRDVSGKATYNILKKLEGRLGDSIIHLCGKTSTAFEKLGLSEGIKIEFNEDISYGEAMCKIINEMKDIKIIGHSCIKRARNKMKKMVVWNILLK
jgi:uroporphyrinogen-III decarboxylase